MFVKDIYKKKTRLQKKTKLQNLTETNVLIQLNDFMDYKSERDKSSVGFNLQWGTK